MTADMSVAPEIARLAEAVLLVPAQPATPAAHAASAAPAAHAASAAPAAHAASAAPAAHAAHAAHAAQQPDRPEGHAGNTLTLGTLARRLRSIAATPERWWCLVRFEPGRSVQITVEECAAYRAWLVVLPPGDAGQSCDCDVATMIAGQATEGTPASAMLRPGPVRVHGERHALHGRGTGYSISLHARAHRPAMKK